MNKHHSCCNAGCPRCPHPSWPSQGEPVKIAYRQADHRKDLQTWMAIGRNIVPYIHSLAAPSSVLVPSSNTVFVQPTSTALPPSLRLRRLPETGEGDIGGSAARQEMLVGNKQAPQCLHDIFGWKYSCNPVHLTFNVTESGVPDFASASASHCQTHDD